MTFDQSTASRKPAPKSKKTYGKNVKSHISGWFGRDLWNAVEPVELKKAKDKELKKEKDNAKRRSVEEDDDADIEKQLARELSERQLLRRHTGPEDGKRKSTTSIGSVNTDDIPGTPEHEELEANILALLDGIQTLDMAETPPAEQDDDNDNDNDNDNDEGTSTSNNTPATREEPDHKSIIENSDKENDEPSLPVPAPPRASRKRSSDASREALKERPISPERDPESLVESPARKNGVRKKGSLAHRMSLGSPVTSPLKKETMAPEVVKLEDIKVWEDAENTLGKPEQKPWVEAENDPKEKTPVIEILDSEDEREDERRRKATQETAKPKHVKAPAQQQKAPVIEIIDSEDERVDERRRKTTQEAAKPKPVKTPAQEEKAPVIEILDSEDERVDERRRKTTQETAKPKPVKAPTQKEKAPVLRAPAIIHQEEISHQEQYDSDDSELTVQGDYSNSLPVDDLLSICTIPRIVNFTHQINTILATSTITKLGEASYSEVFLQLTPTSTSTIATVLKIIPFGGPDQCGLPSIIQEVSITDAMGLIPGYIGFRGAYVVRGVFPQALMDEWDAYEEERGSENERPGFYEELQLFAVIMLEMGGRDLEHFELRGWEEANSVFWQVAVALGRGEREREFEHRDLHFGNIVIRREYEVENWNVDEDDNQSASLLSKLSLNEPEIQPPIKLLSKLSLNEPEIQLPVKLLSKLSLNEPEIQLPVKLLSKLSLNDVENQKPALKVSLIDYTLSRAICGATPASAHMQHAPLDDPALFTGKGDYQFDIYRFMRTHISSGIVPPEEEDIDWNVYAPKTNVFWLHYLTNILLNKKGIPRPAARGRFAASEAEKKAFKQLEQAAKLIDPRKKKFGAKGGMTCAGDLVEWAVEQGIVDEGVWEVETDE